MFQGKEEDHQNDVTASERDPGAEVDTGSAKNRGGGSGRKTKGELERVRR